MTLPQLISSFRVVLEHPENEKQIFTTLLRIAWWKVNQWFLHLPAIVSLTPLTRCICDPRSSYGSLIVYTRYPEYAEMEFIHRYISKNDIVIDVGANIGGVTLLAAEKATVGKVYSFEPTPATCKVLRSNISLNNYENRVEIIEQAVSDKTGRLRFTLTANSEVNHLNHNGSDVGIQVQASTLDSFSTKKSIKRIHLLKIDVEGAEHKVLLGSHKLLTDHRVEVILVELNKNSLNFGHSNQETAILLSSYDYSLFTLSKNLKLNPIHVHQISNQDTINVLAISNRGETMKKTVASLKKR